jgi:protein SCO1/2
MISRRKMFAGAAVFPLASGLLVHGAPRKLAAVSTSSNGKRQFAPPLSGREVMRRRYFPNTELVTSDGEKVRFYDDLLKDKIVILNMMYAKCDGVCPTTISNLKAARKILRREINHDIYVYSMTVKPEQDSPAALKAYARMHEVDDPQWLFLTGKPDELDLLRRKLGFADPNPDKDKDKSRHSGMIRYGNEPMAIWGMCQGSAEPEWIAEEIGFAIPRKFKRRPRVND